MQENESGDKFLQINFTRENLRTAAKSKKSQKLERKYRKDGSSR